MIALLKWIVRWLLGKTASDPYKTRLKDLNISYKTKKSLILIQTKK
jgi:hypothetical protein